ncbi:YcjF family protein [Succinimonas amylolytica]|uniref:YcjF family protein n=1 Tax=Succinimonas amylolytica TaxID=83769 RepID=UPI00035DF0C1|nr:YcjF family protein [Succinimonas amylolytica]
MKEEMRGSFVIEDEKDTPKVFGEDLLSRLKNESSRDRTASDNIASFEVDAAPEDLEDVSGAAETFSAATTVDLGIEEDPAPEKARFWTSPVLWGLLFVFGWGALEIISLIADAYAQSPYLGYGAAGGLGFLLLVTLWLLYRELGTVLLLKEADKHREEVRQARKNGSFNEALALCEEMAQASGIRRGRAFQGFVSRLESHFSAEEVFRLYETDILADQDRRAREIIVRRSAENGAVVALSPLAWLDMIFTFARSLRLIREVAEVYGFKPGVWGRMQLYRRVARNLVFIGLTDLATDAVVDAVGAGVTGKLSAALGQGVAAAIYSSRLGYMAVKAVRPVPLTPEVLTLGALRKDLLNAGVLARLLKQGSGRDSAGK